MTDETRSPEEGEAEPSLHDIISSAIDGSEEEAEKPEEPKAEEEAEEEKPEESDQEEAPEEESEEDEGEGEDDTASVEPHEHWSEEDKEKFNSLPDEAKEYVLEIRESLEKGYQDKFEEVAEFRKERDTLDNLFEPWKDQLASVGMDRTQWIERAISAQKSLMSDPVKAIAWLARDYKVEPEKLAEEIGLPRREQKAEDDEFLSPEEKRIQELEARLERFEKSGQESQEQQATLQATQVISAFQNAKDESGNPKHPHFAKVQKRMGGLLASGAAKDMEDAYDQAVWADPELRQELTSKQREEEAKKAEAKRKEEVKKAKKASKNVKSSAKTTQAQEPDPQDLRGLLNAAIEKASA